MGATKGQLEIAILAWGSLLWEGGREFDDWHDEWHYDGPSLKIEFSRISNRRLGALTLVIDDECGSPVTVAWCRSKRRNVDDAIRDLRGREDTITENIGRVVLNHKGEPSSNSTTKSDPIVTWASEKKVDAVIWTALTSNFADKTEQPFSLNAVIAYVKALNVEGKLKAAEYVWRAPTFVQTPIRTALQQEPWFSKPIPYCA